MNKFWIRNWTRYFLVSILAIVGGIALPTAFAQTGSSQSSEKAQINPTDIQKALKEAGFYKGTIDGVLGGKSKAAIRAFQTQNSLRADGVCGPKTWEKLEPYLPKETAETMVSQNTSPPPSTLEETTDSDLGLEPTEPATGAENGELKQKLVS